MRVMRRFSITEISGVVAPAQKDARVRLFKRHQEGTTKMSYANVDKGALAQSALACAGEAIRKNDPGLTEAQAFARACDAYPDVLKIERQASRDRLYSRSGTPIARTEPEVLDEDFDEITSARVRALVEEERRRAPFLSPEQAFARVYNSPAMREHRARLKEMMQAAVEAGSTAEFRNATRQG